MTAVALVQRGKVWQLHREDCRDIQPVTTGGWDVDTWQDIVDEVFEGDVEEANGARIMPCVGITTTKN